MAQMDIRSKLVFEVEDREFDQHTEEVKNFNRAAPRDFERGSDRMSRAATRSSATMKAAFASVVAFVGTALIGAVTAVQKKLFELATAAEETASKFNTTFGDAAARVDEFVNTFGRLAGLSRTQGREITATLGAVAQGFGASKQASADFAIEVTRTAADMASFNNTRMPDMLQAIRSGLAGEIEPLRRYGIELSAANVEQKAFQMTGKQVADELTQQEKTYARLALIQEQAAIQMGDLERTQNSAANQWRRLTANVRQQAEDYAQKWLPIMTKVIAAANALFASSTELAGAVKTARAEISDLTRIERAIDTVERLQDKTNRSAAENHRLREALELIQDRFPGYIKQTNAAGEAMSFYADELRRAVSEQRRMQNAIESERLGELAERFLDARQNARMQRAVQQEIASVRLPAARERFRPLAGRSLLSSERGLALAEVEKFENDLREAGEQALTFEARMRDADRAIVELFKAGDDFNADEMIDALAATGMTMRAAQRAASQLIAEYIRLDRAQRDLTDTAPKVDVPGSAADLPVDDLRELFDNMEPLITEDDVRKAQEIVRSVTEAQHIASAASEEERRALSEIFDRQEEIANLEKQQRVLGAEAVREQLAFARERLRLAREELSEAEELRKQLQEAARHFSGLVGRGPAGAMEAAGFTGPTKRSLADLTTGGLFNEKVLRSAGMTADEAKRIADNLQDALERGEDLVDVFEGIGKAIRAVTRMVDVFGDLDENVRHVAEGLADVLENAEDISSIDLSEGLTVSQFTSIVSTAAGIASMVGGLISALQGDSDERRREAQRQMEVMKRLTDALDENRRAFEQSARALFRSPIVGSGFSAGDIQRGRGIEQSLRGSLFRRNDGRLATSLGERQIRMMLADLEEMGFADGLVDMLENLLENEDFSLAGALQNILLNTGLFGHLHDLSEQFGQFSGTIEGARARFEFLQRFLGEDLPAAFNGFVDHILASVDGLDEDLRALLEEARGIDLSTTDGRSRLREIAATIMASLPDFSGELSLDELQQLADVLLGAAEGGARDGAAGETQRTAQSARMITEITGSELVAVNAEQLFVLQQVRDLLRSIAATFGAQTIIDTRPPQHIPLPLNLSSAVSRVTSSSAPIGTAAAMRAAGGVNISVNGVDVVSPKPLEHFTKSDWEWMASKIGTAVADQIRDRIGNSDSRLFG